MDFTRSLECINSMYGKTYTITDIVAIEDDMCGWYYIGVSDKFMANPWYITKQSSPEEHTYSCDDYYMIQEGTKSRSSVITKGSCLSER